MAVAEKQGSVATDYVVLEQRTLKDAEGNDVVAWVEAGTASATQRLYATQEVAGDREGMWRAVPVRNWAAPIKTWIETTKRTRAEEAEPF